jgi:Domain of unknown function (DUF5615)
VSRLYADEDFDKGVVARLRLLGHDVLTVQEAGRCGGPDTQVLADATIDGRAVLTFNRRHFRKLHRRNAAHEGIIACRRDFDINGLAQRIHLAVTALSTLKGRCLRINRPPGA